MDEKQLASDGKQWVPATLVNSKYASQNVMGGSCKLISLCFAPRLTILPGFGLSPESCNCPLSLSIRNWLADEEQMQVRPLELQSEDA